MAWIQLQLKTGADHVPELEALMQRFDAVSVTLLDGIGQPLYEPGPGETPLWGEILLCGLFPDILDAGKIIAQMKQGWLPRPLPPVSTQILEDKPWERAWMDDFKPLRFGRRLWVCPSWCPVPDPTAVNLMLDPGLAFGTGTHSTTALCLEWLDANSPVGQTLVDYGCGSGILAIAALLLGATKVTGVDNDSQALAASRDNAEKNSIPEHRCDLHLPEDFNAVPVPAGGFDGILANILADPLISLAARFATLLKPGGWLLLSGVLEDQADEVVATCRP